MDAFNEVQMKKLISSASTDDLPESQDFGPWHVSKDGKYIDSDNFSHDVKLVVEGDFASDEQRRIYAIDIARRLEKPDSFGFTGAVEEYFVNVYREAICESWYSADQASRQATKDRIGLLKFTTYPDGSFEIERMELPK